MNAHQFIFALYVFVGPLAWAGLSFAMYLGRTRMSRLERWRGNPPENPPHVCVMVPAKDEGPRIRQCIESILKQDYPNFSVIAVNDRSTDETGPVLDALAKEQSRVRVVHIDSLPAGWLGKCHALWRGTEVARQQDANHHEWYFFVDSDVTLSPNALSHSMSFAIARNYDMFSILTALECYGFLERLILPLAAAVWSVMFTISMTNNESRTENATANGQFLLIRRSVYESVGGHEAVKAQLVEDVELARLIKLKGYSIRFFSGGKLASTRMHASVQQMFHGWGRIFSMTSRRKMGRIIAAMLYLVVGCLSAYIAFAYGIEQLLMHREKRWLIASLVHLGLVLTMLTFVYRWSRNSIRYVLFFPLAIFYLIGFLAFALRICKTGRVEWRSTHYDLTAMQAGSGSN